MVLCHRHWFIDSYLTSLLTAKYRSFSNQISYLNIHSHNPQRNPVPTIFNHELIFFTFFICHSDFPFSSLPWHGGFHWYRVNCLFFGQMWVKHDHQRNDDCDWKTRGENETEGERTKFKFYSLNQKINADKELFYFQKELSKNLIFFQSGI